MQLVSATGLLNPTTCTRQLIGFARVVAVTQRHSRGGVITNMISVDEPQSKDFLKEEKKKMKI